MNSCICLSVAWRKVQILVSGANIQTITIMAFCNSLFLFFFNQHIFHHIKMCSSLELKLKSFPEKLLGGQRGGK